MKFRKQKPCVVRGDVYELRVLQSCSAADEHTYLWLVGNGGMGYNYNYYYYHSSIPY